MSARVGVTIPAREIPLLIALVMLLIGGAAVVGLLVGLNFNADLAISARNAEVFQRTRADVYEERLAGKHGLARPKIRACFMADVDSVYAVAVAEMDAELGS